MKQADKAQPADVLFVHADARNLRTGFFRSSRRHDRLQDPPQAGIARAEQTGHLCHRHRLRQRQHQRLEQQRKTTARARPGHRHLCGLAAGCAAHARQGGMNESAVLEEMQMLPGVIPSVMNRLTGGTADRAAQTKRLTTDVEMDLTRLRRKANVGDAPRRRQSQRRREQGFRSRHVCAPLFMNASIRQPEDYRPIPLDSAWTRKLGIPSGWIDKYPFGIRTLLLIREFKSLDATSKEITNKLLQFVESQKSSNG